MGTEPISAINKFIMRYTPAPTYTQRFALWPQRLDSGAWIWLEYYYITPNSNGEGRLLSHREYTRETGRTLG